MSNDFKTDIRKPLMLAVVACLGAGTALKWPDIQRAYGSVGQETTAAIPPAPPVLPADEAEQQLSFRPLMPTALPAGTELQGIQLVPIVSENEDAVIAHVRQVQRPITGYGVIYRVAGDKYVTRAWQGSPAEKAGLPSTEEVELLAVDGHKTVFDQAGVARAKLPYVNSLMHSAPLVITYKATDGTTKSVTLDHPGTFMFGAEYPPKQPKYAANIVYVLQGKEFDISELASVGGRSYSFPTTSMNVRLGNKSVWFSNNNRLRSATWTQSGLEINVDNRRGALDKKELTALIASI